MEMTNKIDNLLKALNNQALITPRKDTKDTNSGTDAWESQQALSLEGSREAYNPHQAVYLIVVV